MLDEKEHTFVVDEVLEEKIPGKFFAEEAEKAGILDSTGGEFSRKLWLEGMQLWREGLEMQQKGMALMQQAAVSSDMADLALFVRQETKKLVNPDPENILSDTYIVHRQEKRQSRGYIPKRGDQVPYQIKEDDRWYCSECDHTTGSRDGMMSHIQKVHKQVKLHCPSCDYKTYAESSLRSHCRRNHQFTWAPSMLKPSTSAQAAEAAVAFPPEMELKEASVEDIKKEAMEVDEPIEVDDD